MQYVCSDIHGRFDKYQQLLQRLELKEDDTLYILGDMIDRGPHGLKILMDAVEHPQIVPLLGNHEYIAAMLLPWLMKEITKESTQEQEKMMEYLEDILAWQADGGKTTLQEFSKLSPARRQWVMDVLPELTVYQEVNVKGNTFVLVHAGLDNFSPQRPLEDYQLEELILCRPNVHQTYFKDKYLVVGHTPTQFLFAQDNGISEQAFTPNQFPNDIFHKDKLYAIDCGCVFSGRLGCLCLDTLEEIYV